MYSKQIGKYTIVADLPPRSIGKITPKGLPLKKNEDGDEYQQDYFKISILSNLHVVDEDGNICTPIIKEIEVMNSGYVCTWASTFWVQGFAILHNQIYFISVGEEEGMYYDRKEQFNKIKSNTINVIDYETFLETCIEPINLEIEVNLNLNDWWSGKKKLSDYMLL